MVDKPLGKPRVYPGGLLVTRAFGDFQAKLPIAGGKPGTVIHTPDPIREVEIDPSSWLYFIVASDGVWDALTDRELVKVLKVSTCESRTKMSIVHRHFLRHHKHLLFPCLLRSSQTEKEEAEFDYGKKDETKEKVRRRICKGLIDSSTDSPYWSRNNADADNTTAIVLFFE